MLALLALSSATSSAQQDHTQSNFLENQTTETIQEVRLGILNDGSELLKSLSAINSDSRASRNTNLAQLRSQQDTLWAGSQQKEGRTTTFQKIKTPDLSAPPPTSLSAALPTSLSNSQKTFDQKQPAETAAQVAVPETYIVEAVTYNKRITNLRWWPMGEGREKSGNTESTHSCWSNVDWSHLTGMGTFHARGQDFHYILLHGNVSLSQLRRAKRRDSTIEVPQIPRELPRLRNGGARYLMTSGDESDESAMEFIEAIHEVYDVHKDTLKTTYKKRQRALKQLETARSNGQNPNQKDDLHITYWNNDANLPENQPVNP